MASPEFIALAALMVIAATLLLVIPLLRKSSTPATITAAVVIAVTPLSVAGLYLAFTSWSAQRAVPVAADQPPSVEQMVSGLEQRLRDQPNDLEGWMMLGRSYVVMGRYNEAVTAYQRARQLSGDEQAEALTGYAEALALASNGRLAGEPAQLFERVLQMAPNDRKALWYGGLAALEQDDPALATQRWRTLLAMNPPEAMARLLREQIASIDGAPAQVAPAQAAGAQGGLQVAITIPEQVRATLPAQAPVFILARPVGEGGAPLAVIRRTVAELPMTVVLTDADAMIPTRKLSDHEQVEVVARVALGGTPTAQPGDAYGSSVTRNRGEITVSIDRVF